MGKKKIVIDTNILISAFGWGGNSRDLIDAVMDKEYEFIISIDILEELKRVLDYPKFKFSEEQKRKFLEIIFKISTVIDTKLKLNVCDDENDNIFLECAIEGKADYIISGDDDLLRMKKFRDIKIISVKEFLV
jgi:putative PIN family toxin of toxin-antitoxin system